MKNLITLYIIIILISISRETNSQIPTYQLTARNFEFNCGIYTSWDFDIYIQHTNAPTVFEYAGGQFYLSFGPVIANGGILNFSIIGSDLPANMRPRNPTVGIASSPAATVLRLAINPFPGAGNGYIVPDNGYPGTKIVRVRLTTTSTSFYGNDSHMNLQWRNPPVTSFATKIFAYVGTANTDITTTDRHYIEPNPGPMFIQEVMPWEGCQGKLLSVNSAIEGLYVPGTDKLNRKDTVTVELRNDAYPYSVLYTAKCRMDSIDLSSFHVFTFFWFPVRNYYVVIKHHNSIETWSKNFVALYRAGNITTYNFIDSAQSTYGNNTKLIGTRYCIYSGDVNQDGVIDGVDMAKIDNDTYNSITGYVNTDLNGDYFVDGTDLFIGENNAVNFVHAVTPLN